MPPMGIFFPRAALSCRAGGTGASGTLPRSQSGDRERARGPTPKGAGPCVSGSSEEGNLRGLRRAVKLLALDLERQVVVVLESGIGRAPKGAQAPVLDEIGRPARMPHGGVRAETWAGIGRRQAAERELVLRRQNQPRDEPPAQRESDKAVFIVNVDVHELAVDSAARFFGFWEGCLPQPYDVTRECLASVSILPLEFGTPEEVARLALGVWLVYPEFYPVGLTHLVGVGPDHDASEQGSERDSSAT
jgi:hypothetical protein